MLVTREETDDAAAAADSWISLTSDGEYSNIPFSSRREYKHIILSNGLRVLLVHERGLERCSAALSIKGAGQFNDPPDLPGCAHLMEHTVLSSRPIGPPRTKWDRDFEDWLENYDGGSNGFTAAGKVCFHFTCPQPEVFPTALYKFAALFDQANVEAACRDEVVLRREIRRIDAELDLSNDNTRAFYLLKNLANENHPFARFGAGNLHSLEGIPTADGINVSERLISFFDVHYNPSDSVLVVIGPDNVKTLERLVAPFSDKLSNRQSRVETANDDTLEEEGRDARRQRYPEPFRPSNYTQTILVKANEESSRQDEKVDLLSLEWALDIDYDEVESAKRIITAPAIGFIISQILGRQGPGSLNSFLLRRQWVPPGLRGKARISFPVDVARFQVMRLQIGLTTEGFANRSAVIAAVFSCLKGISTMSPPNQPFLLPRELVSQYMTIAYLHGYILAPRPSDAVELAVDAQTFGLDGQGVGVLGSWPIFPPPDDRAGVEEVSRAVRSVLTRITDPTRTIAIITARRQSIMNFVGGLVDPSLPPLGSPQWKRERLTDAQYYVENVASLDRLVVAPMLWALSKFEGDELGPPFLNPLVPARIRPARPVMERTSVDGTSRVYYLDGAGEDRIWREFITQIGSGSATSWQDRSMATLVGDRWKLYQALQAPGRSDASTLPLPIISPEPSCRCSFVLQLLSSRPREANVRQAARSQLWLLSFDDDIVDLAELGAPAGLAYDLSFNEYGLRICFRGLSQTLPSYARRFSRRLVQHHARIVEGSVAIGSATKRVAVSQARRLQGSPLRKRQIIGNLITSSSLDAASEGLYFLNSCEGGLGFAQGDILPNEAIQLCKELKSIFSKVATENYRVPLQPNLKEILAPKPYWKPKTSSPLLIPGVALISDACGRVQR